MNGYSSIVHNSQNIETQNVPSTDGEIKCGVSTDEILFGNQE